MKPPRCAGVLLLAAAVSVAGDAGGKVVKIFDRRHGRDIVWTRTAGKS